MGVNAAVCIGCGSFDNRRYFTALYLRNNTDFKAALQKRGSRRAAYHIFSRNVNYESAAFYNDSRRDRPHRASNGLGFDFRCYYNKFYVGNADAFNPRKIYYKKKYYVRR